MDVTSYGPGCEIIATHISCPSAKRVEFVHQLEYAGDNVSGAIYRPSTSWNAIVHQYAKETLERVVLKMAEGPDLLVSCSIAFRSSDRTTLKLCYTHRTVRAEYETETILEERLPNIFSQAIQTIRDHPRVANLKHLHIQGWRLAEGNLELVTDVVGRLLGFMGPLEKLSLYGCDLRPYLDPFLDSPLFPKAIQPTSFHPIKTLAIINPLQSLHDEVYAAAIVKLAKSQHARKVPFEVVLLSPTAPSPPVKYELVAFVDWVGLYDEPLSDEDES